MLRSLVKDAPAQNKTLITDVVGLYERKLIPNYRTALNTGDVLASKQRNTMKTGRPTRLCSEIVAKYPDADPIMGRLSEPIYYTHRGDYSEFRTHTNSMSSEVRNPGGIQQCI